MENPDITIICNKPNNGYYAMVYTDDGMIISSACTRADVYNGLLHAVAKLLLDTVELSKGEIRVDSDNIDNLDELASAIAIAHNTFANDLERTLLTQSTARAMQHKGLPEMLAQILANALESIRSKSESEKSEEDDSEESE